MNRASHSVIVFLKLGARMRAIIGNHLIVSIAGCALGLSLSFSMPAQTASTRDRESRGSIRFA